MKLCYTLLTTAFFLLSATTVKAGFLPVKDTLITTDTKNCGIHYLTQGNTTGWHLTDVMGKCPDNLLNGPGNATIRNAFGQEIVTLKGYWTQGYWTGPESVPVIIKNLRSDDSESQVLFFHMGQDKHTNVYFLGKMISTRRDDGSFGPFKACNPANILAVTNRTDVFENELLQQELFNAVLARVRVICPKANSIYLFGSNQEEPDSEDISFFAEINFQEKQIKVKRLPSSLRSQYTSESDDVQRTIPKPREIRQEGGQPIIQVKPIIPTTTLPVMVDNPPSNITQAPTAETLIELPQEQITPTETIEEWDFLTPTVPDRPTLSEGPAFNTPTDLPTVLADTLDKVPHLLTISRLLKQPIHGKALIHISRFEGSGMTVADEPVQLQVKGEHLSLGWGIAEGMFSYTPRQDNLSESIGFIQIDSFTPVSERPH